MADKKDYPKEQLYTETLIYQGKTLKKEGKTKDKEWKIWQLLFGKGNYGFKCSSFDPLTPKSLQIKDLIEGKYYEVVYSKKPFESQYGPSESKQVALLKLGIAEKSTENVFAAKDAIKSEQKPLPLTTPIQSWEDFAAEYNTAMEGNPQKSAIHMLGAHIANHHAEQFKEVIDNCKKNFKK